MISINPFIRHYEAAHFDIDLLRNSREAHDAHRLRRKRRDTTSNNSSSSVDNFAQSPAKTIKLNFYAHNR